MKQSIDWCYICYALSTQISAILLACLPRWYFFQALGSNLLWMLPWAIAVSKMHMTENNAWKWHSIIFGGALGFSLFNVLAVTALWAWLLTRAGIRLPPLRSYM